MTETRFPDAATIAKGALAGLAAGLVASLAMNRFQAVVAHFSDDDGAQGESSTAKAADAIVRVATGTSLPEARKEPAGNVLHYALGGALGVTYGIAAEVRPGVTAGFGGAFGLATFAALDEVAVPATGLAPWAPDTPLGTHAYAGVSHLVFGAVTEGVRRLVRGWLR